MKQHGNLSPKIQSTAFRSGLIKGSWMVWGAPIPMKIAGVQQDLFKARYWPHQRSNKPSSSPPDRPGGQTYWQVWCCLMKWCSIFFADWKRVYICQVPPCTYKDVALFKCNAVCECMWIYVTRTVSSWVRQVIMCITVMSEPLHVIKTRMGQRSILHLNKSSSYEKSYWP